MYEKLALVWRMYTGLMLWLLLLLRQQQEINNHSLTFVHLEVVPPYISWVSTQIRFSNLPGHPREGVTVIAQFINFDEQLLVMVLKGLMQCNLQVFSLNITHYYLFLH